MNYMYLLIEVLIVFLLMVAFYKVGKKDGLYIYVGLISSILSIVLIGNIDILSFPKSTIVYGISV